MPKNRPASKSRPTAPKPYEYEFEETGELFPGTVLRAVGGGLYDVRLEADPSVLPPLVDTNGVPIEDAEDGGLRAQCFVSGKLKKGRRLTSQPIAVGDRVQVRPLPGSGASLSVRRVREGTIEDVLPRSKVLGRSRYGKYLQVTVANLDQIVVVMSLRMPDLSTHRLDRFLVLAEASDLRAVICINKIDLVPKRSRKKEIEPLQKLYGGLGYPVIAVAAEKDENIEELREELKGHISAFVGSSGVGKSSLAMAIQPELQLWVGEVMEIGKGRHTTTEVSLHPLDGGGYIADTPGIKTVTLLEQAEVNLPNCFPEFRRLANDCRFNDCTHTHEPGCAVRAALEEKPAKGEEPKVAQARYDSYLRMLEDDLASLRLMRET
jgi:ribosome biogenesis GTPase